MNIRHELVSFFILIIVFTGCSRNNLVSINDELSRYESQIWQEPASAIRDLESFSLDRFSIDEKMYWNLLHELALSRLGYSGSPDSIMNMVINFYNEHGLHAYSARAYYVQGLEYMMQARYFDAMLSLKEAERIEQNLPDTLPYKCLIYIAEGRIAETEYLHHIAYTYYSQALSHAITLGDNRRIACCYNDMARTHSEYNDSLSHQYFSQAIDIAKTLPDTLLYYDILIQKEGNSKSIDSTIVYNYAKFLTDTMCVPFYSHIVIEYLQNHGQSKEAEKYLDFCALDTNSSNWSREHYQYLSCRQMHLTGNSRQAFYQLENLYLNQTEQIYRHGKVRTYTISRMYDLEQEKNKNLELTVEKQHLWITIGIIVSILIIVIFSAVYIIHMHRELDRARAQAHEIDKLKAQAAEEEANKEIDRLNMELELKRVMLRDSLKKRIELSRKMAASPDDIKTQVQNPSDWLTEWLEENTFINGGNNDKLIAEFQAIYGNLLGNLKKKYPSLTEKDLLFIALSVLGLDVNDIGYIFGTTDRTIWNRRQFIKNRIGNSKMDFEEWIKKLRRKDRKGRV